MTPETPRARRPRDPEASRAAILVAARAAFTELGYDGASIREIARRAGAATGLVLRHFASKELLFVAAFEPAADAAGSGGVEALVASVVAGQGPDVSPAPFLALIRSAASRPEAAAALRRELQREARAVLGVEAGGPDADLRMDLLGALMIGLTFVRHVLADGPLADATPEEAVRVSLPLARVALDAS